MTTKNPTTSEHKQFWNSANHIYETIKYNCKKLYVKYDKTLTTSMIGSKGGLLKASKYYIFNNKKYDYPINLDLVQILCLNMGRNSFMGESIRLFIFSQISAFLFMLAKQLALQDALENIRIKILIRLESLDFQKVFVLHIGNLYFKNYYLVN